MPNYWSCERCRLGRASSKDHTRQQGCRLAPSRIKGPPVIAGTDDSRVSGPADTQPPPVPPMEPPGTSSSSSSSTTPTPTVDTPPTTEGGATVPEPEKVLVPPAFIEPSFNLRSILKRLRNSTVSDAEKQRDLLGVHIKFWHAPASDMMRFLAIGRGWPLLRKLLEKTIPWKCKECMSTKRTMTKPLVKISLESTSNSGMRRPLT